MNTHFRLGALICTALMFTCGNALADSITVRAFDAGWYQAQYDPTTGLPTQTGFHDQANQNFIAGYVAGGTPSHPLVASEFRNFFIFDLTGIGGEIVSADLRLSNPLVEGVPNDYSLFDVASPITALQAGGAGQGATFHDLGSGVVLGGPVAPTAGSTVSISFNTDGIAALNANVGHAFALGGATSLSALSFANGLAFDFTGGPSDVRDLVLTTVPEPGSIVLVTIGIAAARRHLSRVNVSSRSR